MADYVLKTSECLIKFGDEDYLKIPYELWNKLKYGYREFVMTGYTKEGAFVFNAIRTDDVPSLSTISVQGITKNNEWESWTDWSSCLVYMRNDHCIDLEIDCIKDYWIPSTCDHIVIKDLTLDESHTYCGSGLIL